jgi:hypothetical protein
VDASTNRLPNAFTIDHIETERLEPREHNTAVDALAALINEWNNPDAPRKTKT